MDGYQTIDLERIIPSPTNPRKVFDQDRLQELADSIKAEGLLQPIVVRPAPDFELVPGRMSGKEGFLWESRARSVLGGFAKRREDADAVRPLEIVVGERRFRAAKLAGLEAIPAVVRDLTDVQVLEAQVVENAQRENVLPSEQAAGCRAVVKALGAEKAAARLGKSVAWVRGFLLLEDCPEDLLAAVDGGKVGRTVAELVCRLPRREQRDLAARCVLAGVTEPKDLSTLPPGGHEVLSFRETKAMIAAHFQRELKGAPFDQKDKRLVPNATSCKDCPERSGNAKAVDPEAYADTRDDVCLNPACYRDKCEAQKLRDTLKARSAPPPATNGRTPLPTVGSVKEWSDSMKAAGAQTGEDRKAERATKARPAAKPVGSRAEEADDWRLAERAHELLAAELGLSAEGLFGAVLPKLDKRFNTVLGLLARQCVRWVHDVNPDAVLDRRGIDPERVRFGPAAAGLKALSKLDGDQLLGLVVELAVGELMPEDADVPVWCKALEVKARDVEKRARKELEPAGALPDRPTRPEIDLEGRLWDALHSVQDAAKRWDLRRQSGLSDFALKEAIGGEFGDGGSGGPGLAWIRLKGGTEPAFWYGKAANSTKAKPTLKGKALIDAVRRILAIPFPADQGRKAPVGFYAKPAAAPSANGHAAKSKKRQPAGV